MRNKYESTENMQRVAVIGAGWNGSHIAKSLADRGYTVTLFERNHEIFSGISGSFGIRLHAGPHYPRSPATRKACRDGFNEFCLTYPTLINEHHYSVYAIGNHDADGRPSKVSETEFRNACKEFNYRGEVSLNDWGYDKKTVLAAFDLKEHSAVLNPRLREEFVHRLAESKVEVVCNFSVSEVHRNDEEYIVSDGNKVFKFDHVINTSGYKNLLPDVPLPFSIKPVYQICLALIYKDMQPEKNGKAISFIVMDGAYPCLMPYDNRSKSEGPITNYIMTHGKWTIVSTYDSSQEAEQHLSRIDNQFVEKNIKPKCEEHMKTFWPKFGSRFVYLAWVGGVLAKMDTKTEFRSTIVFQEPKQSIIHVFPGKITNIFEAEREVLSLIQKAGVEYTEQNYCYAANGVLKDAKREVSVHGDELSTCSLQTFRNILESGDPSAKANEFPVTEVPSYNRTSIHLVDLFSCSGPMKAFLLISMILAASYAGEGKNRAFIVGLIVATCVTNLLLYSQKSVSKQTKRTDLFENTSLGKRAERNEKRCPGPF